MATVSSSCLLYNPSNLLSRSNRFSIEHRQESGWRKGPERRDHGYSVNLLIQFAVESLVAHFKSSIRSDLVLFRSWVSLNQLLVNAFSVRISVGSSSGSLANRGETS